MTKKTLKKQKNKEAKLSSNNKQATFYSYQDKKPVTLLRETSEPRDAATATNPFPFSSSFTCVPWPRRLEITLMQSCVLTTYASDIYVGHTAIWKAKAKAQRPEAMQLLM